MTEIAVVAEPSLGGEAGARFADGLTGDLARLGSAMPSLAFVEKGGSRATEPLLLRVALEGTRDGQGARVRLVTGEGGAVVWSRDFPAEGGNIAELRERVAAGVVGVLQCGLERSAQFDEPVGLRLYLGACEGLQTNDFALARTFAQQITAFKPDAPAGWACLANTTIFAAANSGSVDDATLARAEGYARRALKADPGSGLAYVALAMAKGWRGEPMLATLEKGIRIDPDFAMLHRHYALALSGAGMVSQAVDPALKALALQPHEPAHFRIAVQALVNAGRTEDAAALAERAHRIWRFDRDVALLRIESLAQAPDARAALAALAVSPFREEPRAELVRHSLLWRSDPAAFDWPAFDRFANGAYAANSATAWAISLTAARMGDLTRALAWLDRAPATPNPLWTPLFAPEAAALRRNPRFFAKMESVGMVRRWENSGRWPDFCADPALPYDCQASARKMAQATQGDGKGGGRTRART